MATMMDADYCFVVRNAQGQSVQAEIRPHDELARQHYLGVWHKLSQALVKHHQQVGGPPAPEWTAWKPGEWCEQLRGYEARRKYVAWAGSHLVGFLNVWPDFASPHQPGKRVLYIEHLAASPGDQSTELWQRRYAGVGALFLAYAALVSHHNGHEGRLGLHVADAGALAFYRHIHTRCPGGLFFPETTGVAGPTPRGAQEMGKTYLEATETGATRWLEGYRHG